MARPDATALAALNEEFIKPAFFVYLDIVDDPVRATTWGASITFGSVGDADLNGQTFSAIDPTFVDIGEVKNQEGGSETVTAKLSGLLLPDNDLLNTIGNNANWRGRTAKLWQGIYNELNVQQGAVWHYYTGRMVALNIAASSKQQVIELQIENYLATISGPSNRTYLDQQQFDPDDLSAAAKIMAVNGIQKAAQTAGQGGGVGPYKGGYPPNMANIMTSI